MYHILRIFHLKKIQSDTFSQDNIMAYMVTSHFVTIVPGIAITNMRQVQPETLPKNSNFSSCSQNIKLKNNHLKLQTPDSYCIRYRTLFHFHFD
jgi:hypothetical protein